MRVKFVDLQAQYAEIKIEIQQAMQQVVERSAFAGGPFVEAFEKSFAEAHGARFCIGVSSGTAALHLALWTLGIGAGDEVIVPANTFIATASAVSFTGATPVFVECEEHTQNIDPAVIEAAITKHTKAVIAVHLFGQPANLAAVKGITDKHGLILVEDCAQAHLAEISGKRVGTTGLFGCFSFYPAKNLGAFGDAGAVVTNDEAHYETMRALRDHGSRKKYEHEFIGQNYRMDGLQGAILSAKLPHLSRWTEMRRQNAERYRSVIANCEKLVLPQEAPGTKHVYHLFVIRTDWRDELGAYLAENGISTGIHYPIPCHLQPAYSQLGAVPGSLPVVEKLAGEIISLPMFPELTEDEIGFVGEKIMEFHA